MLEPFLIALLVALYYAPMVPGVIRWRREPNAMHPVALFLLLTFLGWTVLGWFAAWIFALKAGTQVSAGGPSQISIPWANPTESPGTWETPKPPTACYTCGGSRWERCTSCFGNPANCTRCQGSGKIVCTGCHGSGLAS